MCMAYLGLGSNLGHRKKNLQKARELIAQNTSITITQESTILETEPVEFIDQPFFLNQVILVTTNYSPFQLHNETIRIEKAMGRKKYIPKGPRIIDIDILLYDDVTLKSEELEIPHPGIINRPFILQHLIELAPSLCDPLTGKQYKMILSTLGSEL